MIYICNLSLLLLLLLLLLFGGRERGEQFSMSLFYKTKVFCVFL
jgi:hypothetical protein